MKKIIFASFALASLVFIPMQKSNAAQLDSNGSYSANYSIGGTNSIGAGMISKYFDDKVKIDKINEFYYTSITLLDNTALTNFEINLSDYKVGVSTDIIDKKTTYTYSLAYDDLLDDIKFSGTVKAMGMDVSFSIKIKEDSITKISDDIDLTVERPARYVPTIKIDSNGEISSQQNATITLPNASATFGSDKCDVIVKAFSPNMEEVEINNNKIVLSDIGTYYIEYSASTSKYKTNLGNDAYSKIKISVISSATGSDIVYLKDVNKILPESYFVQTQSILNGNLYDEISGKLEKISDHFEITNVYVIDSEGKDISLQDNVEFYFKANADFNRNDIKVYYYDNNGNLNEVDSNGYGRYVKLLTSETGTFIICVPGVAFHMPIWGYILIVVGAVILIAGLVSSIIIIRRKHKKSLAI